MTVKRNVYESFKAQTYLCSYLNNLGHALFNLNQSDKAFKPSINGMLLVILAIYRVNTKSQIQQKIHLIKWFLRIPILHKSIINNTLVKHHVYIHSRANCRDL